MPSIQLPFVKIAANEMGYSSAGERFFSGSGLAVCVPLSFNVHAALHTTRMPGCPVPDLLVAAITESLSANSAL